MRRAILVTTSAVIAVLAAAGCSDSGSSDATTTVNSPTSAPKPSISVSVKSAPQQPNSGSRRPVAYDPCVEIGDETISQAGFDPKTRERADQIHQDYAFIACDFKRMQDVDGQTLSVGGLTISSTNVTLDEFRRREGNAATATKVAGREAITYKDVSSESCNIVTSGPDGTIDLMVDSSAALSDWNGCDHAQQIAEIVVAALPKP